MGRLRGGAGMKSRIIKMEYSFDAPQWDYVSDDGTMARFAGTAGAGGRAGGPRCGPSRMLSPSRTHGAAAKNLIQSLLQRDPSKRLPIQSVQQHPWMCQPHQRIANIGPPGGRAIDHWAIREVFYVGLQTLREEQQLPQPTGSNLPPFMQQRNCDGT